MKLKKIMSLVFILMLVASCGGGGDDDDDKSSPKGSNQATVDGSQGTSGDGLSVECASGVEGKVDIPAGSFKGSETIEIQCVNPDGSQARALENAVEDDFPGSKVYGAITLEPSPFSFDKKVTIVIPLFEKYTGSVGDFISVFIYAPHRDPKFERVKEARVLGSHWAAEASVTHFTTFVLIELVESEDVPEGIPIPDVVGLDVDAAYEILKGDGFEPVVREVEAEAGTRLTNQVIAQKPPAGMELPKGDQVVIDVAVEGQSPLGVTLVSFVDGDIAPNLAKQWEVSEDGLEWTFYLTDGLERPDGTAYTSDAVLEALEQNWHMITRYAGAEALDEYTLKIILAEPGQQLLEEVARIEIP